MEKYPYAIAVKIFHEKIWINRISPLEFSSNERANTETSSMHLLNQ